MKNQNRKYIISLGYIIVLFFLGLILCGIYAVLNDNNNCRTIVKVTNKKNNTIILEYNFKNKTIKREKFSANIQEEGDEYIMNVSCSKSPALVLKYDELTFNDTILRDTTFAKIISGSYCYGVLIDNLSWITPTIHVEYYISGERYDRIYVVQKKKLNRVRSWLESDSIVPITYSVYHPIKSMVVSWE